MSKKINKIKRFFFKKKNEKKSFSFFFKLIYHCFFDIPELYLIRILYRSIFTAKVHYIPIYRHISPYIPIYVKKIKINKKTLFHFFFFLIDISLFFNIPEFYLIRILYRSIFTAKVHFCKVVSKAKHILYVMT